MPTARLSTIADARFQPGDLVWVPFPFVEKPRLRDRPAVVLRHIKPANGIALLWVLMVTSAANKGWRGDVSLEDDFGDCGLNVPCIVRTAKIATIDASRAKPCGRLPDHLTGAIFSELADVVKP